jgi:hypothetical protein
MGQMPNWFAKTPEMITSDAYFSLASAGNEVTLIQRYETALQRLQAPDYYRHSDALQTGGWSAPAVSASLGGHFRGDWIHTNYPDPKFVGIGGRYWPQVPSTTVVDRIRHGTIIAIQKALGRAKLGVTTSTSYADQIFAPEFANGVEVDGVRPLATSWVCIAPTGEDYFEVDALRGPSVVEFVIATPRPYGHGEMMPLVEALEREEVREEPKR